MLIRSQGLLWSLAVLVVALVAGCKEQSPPSQTLASPSPALASAPANSVNAAASTNTNASSGTNASSSEKGAIDACKLLTGEEIKSIQSDTLKDATLSPQGNEPFITSQCFYATTNFVNSVSLKVTQQSSNAGAQNIREFWKERFGSAGNEKERERERERDRDKKAKVTEEEDEERAPPERVKGIGEEAYAVGNAKMGALYVLKGDKFLRISIGGSHSQPERIEKMKTLAQYVMKRF